MFIRVVFEINDDRLVTRSSKNCFLHRAFSPVFGCTVVPYSRPHKLPSLIAPPSVYVRPVGFMDVAEEGMAAKRIEYQFVGRLKRGLQGSIGELERTVWPTGCIRFWVLECPTMAASCRRPLDIRYF